MSVRFPSIDGIRHRRVCVRQVGAISAAIVVNQGRTQIGKCPTWHWCERRFARPRFLRYKHVVYECCRTEHERWDCQCIWSHPEGWCTLAPVDIPVIPVHPRQMHTHLPTTPRIALRFLSVLMFMGRVVNMQPQIVRWLDYGTPTCYKLICSWRCVWSRMNVIRSKNTEQIGMSRWLVRRYQLAVIHHDHSKLQQNRNFSQK